MSGDLEKLKETGAQLEKLAEGLNPLYQPLQDARFFIVDAEAKENDYFVSVHPENGFETLSKTDSMNN